MKQNRLEKITEIISNEEVGTQEELIAHLNAAGFNVTQATVSRDMRILKLSKVATGRGKYRYVLPDTDRDHPDARSINISHALAETIYRVETGQNLIVLHTSIGMASAVALEVDHLHHPDLLGCVAGDDTILIVARDSEKAESVAEQIRDLIVKGV